MFDIGFAELLLIGVVGLLVIGPDKLLCVEQKVVLSADPTAARTAARGALSMYADLPNYRNNWLRLGFGEEDLGDGGSNKLIDALVARQRDVACGASGQ